MDEKNKPLFALTVGEFLDLQKKAEQETQARETVSPVLPDSPRYVYGLKGIAALFGCGMVTASKIKRSGMIDRAVTQIGRKIIVDAPLALELVRQSKKGGRRR